MGRVVKQSIEIGRRTGGIKKMYKGGVPKGYVINQYQFARHYKYNSHGFIDYFNSIVDRKEKQNGRYQSPTGYISFGEYDLLEIIRINSFNFVHPLNINDILDTFDVLKFEISKSCNSKHPQNKQDIFSTFDVLNFLRFNFSNNKQPQNILLISITAFVLKLFKSISFKDLHQ